LPKTIEKLSHNANPPDSSALNIASLFRACSTMEDQDHLQPQDDSSNVESLPPITLTETPGTISPPTHSDSVPMSSQAIWRLASLSNADDELTDKLYRDMQKSELLHSLYPYKLALTPGDLESCVALENSCFSPELAASRDKVRRNIYHTCAFLFTL
jgi:hypothetical protein